VDKDPLQQSDLTNRFPPSYQRVVWDIFVIYFLAVLLVTINLNLMTIFRDINVQIIVAIACGIVMSFLFHSLFLFLHEGGHYNIFPDKKTNDWITNFLAGFWFLQNVKDYRRTHWEHHLRHGQIDDPENSYFNPLTTKNLFLAFSGVYAFSKVTSLISKFNKKNTAAFFFGTYQAIVLSIFLYFQAYWQYLVIWFFPFFLGFPFLAFIRQICEHRKPKLGKKNFTEVEHGPYTRVFKKSIVAYFFGAAGFRLHWYHHYNPYISYTRLDDFSEKVKRTNSDLTVQVEKTSYFKIFFQLLQDARKIT
jgi:fatty acid desaturase